MNDTVRLMFFRQIPVLRAWRPGLGEDWTEAGPGGHCGRPDARPPQGPEPGSGRWREEEGWE